MVFVINIHGKPLMPCSPCKARKLLRDNKAKVIMKTPFTIKLLHGSSSYLQHIVGGIDSGSVKIGASAMINNKVVYQAEIALRTNISKKMEQRRNFRRTRRARNTRYRPARFNNRAASTRKGRLPPSLVSKVNSHLREIKFMQKILPISLWKFELAQFDIHKITNPEVSGIDYHNGVLKDFYNVKQYILHRDNYTCQSQQKIKHSSKLHVHHIIFKSNGGSDAPNNLITLCETCHTALHDGKFTLKKKRKVAKTQHATHMGIIKSRLSQSDIPHQITYGYETKYKREQLLNLPKTHANDAIAICVDEFSLPLTGIILKESILIKKHLEKGDYKQRKGSRSEIIIPTGKLFGFRKGDKVMTSRGFGFINGKRSKGYFSVKDIDGNVIHASEKVTNMKRISARSTTQVEEIKLTDLTNIRKSMQNTKKPPALPALKNGVSRSNI